MSNVFRPKSGSLDQVEIFFPAEGTIVSEFLEYSFNSHFLTPSDGWVFVIDSRARSRLAQGGDLSLFDALSSMKPGTLVELHLNGALQSTGYVDSIEVTADRQGGLVYRLEGRDTVSAVVDTCADPTIRLPEGRTLDDVIMDLFEPFGFEDISIDDRANRELKTAAYRAKTRRSEAKGFGRKALKQYKVHQTRPYPREGVFEFASRLSQRFGLWIWPSPDGKRITVSTPDFEQDPEMAIFRSFDLSYTSKAKGGSAGAGGSTNVISGTVKFDISEQPTYIVADSHTVNGDWGPGQIKAIMRNAAVRTASDKAPPELKKYFDAGAVELKLPGEKDEVTAIPEANVMTAPRHKVLYLQDHESATQEHLEAFVRREMSLLQRKSLTAKYVVEGHGQETPVGWRSWQINTCVNVFDEAAGLDEVMWVMSRTFRKSREGGTTTELELIRRNTIVFTDTGDQRRSLPAAPPPKKSWVDYDPLTD